MEGGMRLFAEDVPLHVVQNLITALEPELLTEHSLMLLLHDVSKLMPIEELPKRLLDVLVEYFKTGNGDDDEEEDEHSSTH